MPALPPVPSVVQVLWKGNVSGPHFWVNKMFIGYAGAVPSAADLTTYANNVMGLLVAGLTPLQSPGTTLTEVEVTDLSSALGAVGLNATATAGSRAGGELPANAAVLLSFPISRHYRGGHPRTYLVAGTDTDLLTRSTWTAGFVAAVATAMDTIRLHMLDVAGAFTPTTHVNVSYYGGAPPVLGKSVRRVTPIVDIEPTFGYGVSAEIASQRRRIGRK